jgi:hypothetical protein
LAAAFVLFTLGRRLGMRIWNFFRICHQSRVAGAVGTFTKKTAPPQSH